MTRLLTVVVLVACSSGAGTKTTHPDRPDQGSAGPVATTTEPARTDTQCDKLLSHVVTLAVAERPADQKPTDDERAKLEASVRDAWSGKCRSLTSAGFECASAAKTLGELDGCGR